jgi:hypothetical protein
VSEIAKVDAAARIVSRVSPSASAIDWALTVQTFALVWVIELIREIRVPLKSTPNEVESVVQFKSRSPVTV